MSHDTHTTYISMWFIDDLSQQSNHEGDELCGVGWVRVSGEIYT